MMARRKIVKPSTELDGAELPDLTQQQARFVEGILSGKTASDAYRAAYDASTMTDRSIWAEASRTRAHINVAAWLSAARKAGLGRGMVTLEGHIQELERLKEIAIDTGNVGAAVQAEQLRGKAAGHYIEQHRDLTDYDPLKTLQEIAQTSPDLAAALARQYNVAWEETRH